MVLHSKQNPTNCSKYQCFRGVQFVLHVPSSGSMLWWLACYNLTGDPGLIIS